MSEYFSGGSTSRAEGVVGTYTSLDACDVIEAAPGVLLQVVTGEHVMLSYVTVKPNSEAAVHTHDEEQMGMVLSGSCEFELDGEVKTLGAGDVYLAPPGVPHGVRTGDAECVIVDVFSPPRQALVDLQRARQA